MTEMQVGWGVGGRPVRLGTEQQPVTHPGRAVGRLTAPHGHTCHLPSSKSCRSHAGAGDKPGSTRFLPVDVWKTITKRNLALTLPNTVLRKLRRNIFPRRITLGNNACYIYRLWGATCTLEESATAKKPNGTPLNLTFSSLAYSIRNLRVFKTAHSVGVLCLEPNRH